MSGIVNRWLHGDSAESWAWPNLEPEVRTALASRVDDELARRAIPGALIYFVISIILAISTPYYADHPTLLILAGCLTLLAGGARFISALRLLRRSADSRKHTKLVFFCATYASFGVWGTFCGWTLYLYGAGWTAMFLLLNTAALAAAGSTSLAPSVRLAFRCLILLFIPTVVSAFALGEKEHIGLGVVTIIYLGFLLAQVRINSREFWAASVAAERERIRGSAERRRAESERASLVTAIEQSGEQILITDLDGKLEYCNLAFERLSGYSRSEVIGRNLSFLKSGKHDTEFYRDIWKTILSGAVWTGRFTNKKKDGSLYEVEGTITPILNAGRIRGFVSASHDVTERLRMESQLREAQKLESIGRLAGGVAHDFNNLLGVILGCSELLDKEVDASSPVLRRIEMIKSACQRGASLAAQLLAFGRRQTLRPAILNLNSTVGDTAQMLQRLLGEHIEQTIILDPALGQVKADPGQMVQVIMNLAVNAGDAMPQGGKLTISTANVTLEEGSPKRAEPIPAGRYVMLSVSDTGTGMDEEVRSHIFEPFYTTKPMGKGTGMGLATVVGIVEQSGGSISVDSTPGKGTNFRIYLPRVDEVVQPSESRQSSPTIRGTETILLVEDASELRDLIHEALGAEGYNVLVAANGAEAVELAEKHPGPIDALVTDVIMPLMSGPELARSLAPRRPRMKVLYMSGYPDDKLRQTGISDENVLFIQKPVQLSELARKLRETLDAGGKQFGGEAAGRNRMNLEGSKPA
jgi:PAS domain S-box-containing protein